MQTLTHPELKKEAFPNSHFDQDIKEVKDTILVFEKNGVVDHCFCTEAYAKEWLSVEGVGGSSFTTDGVDADFVYSCAKNIKDRVDEAKDKLRRDFAIRDTLDRHGVPKDKELRTAIYRSIRELQETVLRPVW
jgi:hypothetical protein